jgi:hypothetical protein
MSSVENTGLLVAPHPLSPPHPSFLFLGWVLTTMVIIKGITCEYCETDLPLIEKEDG